MSMASAWRRPLGTGKRETHAELERGQDIVVDFDLRDLLDDVAVVEEIDGLGEVHLLHPVQRLPQGQEGNIG